MEMICRAAEKASFAPPPYQDEDGDWVESDMVQSEREEQPLHEKLLNILPTIINNLCDRKFL